MAVLNNNDWTLRALFTEINPQLQQNKSGRKLFSLLNFVDQGDMAAALRAFNRGVRLLFTVSLKVEDREQLADHKPLTKNIDHIKLKGTDLFKEAMSQDFCIFFLQ